MTSAIARMRNFPLPFTKGDFNYSRSLADFQVVVSKKYEELASVGTTITDNLESIQNDLEQKTNEIETLAKSITIQEDRIETLIVKLQDDYDNFKSSSSEEFESDRETYKQSTDEDSKDLINKLETKLEEAKKLVNLIGNVGITGNYQNIATQHQSSANFWRAVAIFFMIILSGLLIWTIVDLSLNGIDWKVSLVRILGAAVLSYPATYAARESSKHRKLETINRNAELELASIHPFIEDLDEDKKQQIIEKLADKYFGNSIEIDDKSDEELSLSGFERLTKMISSILNK